MSKVKNKVHPFTHATPYWFITKITYGNAAQAASRPKKKAMEDRMTASSSSYRDAPL